MTEDGFPANRTYSDQMFKWIEKTLSESDDFDFLFVAGHYQVIDPRGYYDPALTKRLLPMLKEYNVNAFLQGHRHTVDHVQEASQEPGNGLHFFTVGAGALLNSSSAVAQVLGRDEPKNACFEDDNVNDEARCYFYWAPIQKTGAYAYMTTEASGVTVEFIESAYDRVMYKTVLSPRK